MSKGTTIHATILAVKRERSSVNGNPAWTLHTDRGFFRTQSDASCGYVISDGMRDREAILDLTPAGRVYGIDLL
jgi:hypothetical protein